MSAQLLNDVPYTHTSSIWSFADNTLTSVREALLTAGYGPVTTLAEKAVVSVLQKVTVGRLQIITDEHTYEFPDVGADSCEVGPHAELRVINGAFWVRLCTMGALGFAEAYMFGDVVCEDLISIFSVFIENQKNLASLDSSTVSWLFSVPQRLSSFRFLNSLGNARSNISAHYDLSDDMFKAFLSEDMTYSCAIYSDLDGDLREKPLLGMNNHKMSQLLSHSPTYEAASVESNKSTAHTSSTLPTPPLADTLADAQQRKLAHIVARARISRGHRVLEIGSGWGSMALHIVQNVPDTQVDTITLSDNQCAYVRAMVERLGFSDRIRVHLIDYREMPYEWEGLFDRVVSIEMVEAVGLENIDAYWAAIDRVLKRDTGGGAIQGITLPEARFPAYSRSMDFIQKWVIFPGSMIPSVTLLVNSMERATSGRLLIESISNIGPHYARTLREWRHQFEDNFATIEEALRKDHPGVFDLEQGERAKYELGVFRRKWLYYFCYCEIGFAKRVLGDHIFTFTREGYKAMGCDVYE